MSTVQIAGIAVVVVILIVIVISLIITRRKDDGGGRSRETDLSQAEDSGSLFDEAPRDQLHMLGKRDVAEQFAESQPQPRWQPPAAAEEVAQAAPAAVEQYVAQVPVEAPDEIAAEPAKESPAQTAAPATETPEQTTVRAEAVPSPTGSQASAAKDTEPIAAEGAPDASSPAAEDAGPEPRSPAAEEPAEGLPEAPAADAAEDEAPGQSRMVRLSDIIVTTNEQQVDLADQEVRRMLKDLMQDEIDLAAQYRELGRNIDAVLQLTEARRICGALGMTSHARLIQQMINELQ